MVTETNKGSRDRTARSVACLKKGSKSVDSSQKDGGGSVSSGFIAFRVVFRANDRIIPSGMKRVAPTDSSQAQVNGLDQMEALEALQGVFRAGGVEPAAGVWA